MNRDIIDKYRASDSPSASRDRVAQNHDAVNIGYQELRDLRPSSPYDSIHLRIAA
ncbi:hypothetical protein MHBO_004695 [Bonamia ostreae]|uniref:Uncharacterized protein n=1 Tax=Bonamia ostreae TaxID=126728 RepID=A0ABV2AUT0_9EUKA